MRKGWYCDITRPATVRGGELIVEDLDLDLWRSADGADVRRLDEDEFAASGLATSDPAAAAAALAALDTLELLARRDDFETLLGQGVPDHPRRTDGASTSPQGHITSRSAS